MEKCFLCGKEFDPKERPKNPLVRIDENGKEWPITKISTGERGIIYKSCAGCTKAGAFYTLVFMANANHKPKPLFKNLTVEYLENSNAE